jgi:dTDP-4-dehydrorhamnose 3,5-epimerase
MQIDQADIADVLILQPSKHVDARGFFSETYRADLLKQYGVDVNFVQENFAHSAERGVLRGLHYQIPPKAQGKLVQCMRGLILDVAVDIRRGSPTFRRHVSLELSSANMKLLWIPVGFAHGYVTLESNCEVVYKVTDYYAPECDRGIAWNDADLAIDWQLPASELSLSPKDQRQPRLAEASPAFNYLKDC